MSDRNPSRRTIGVALGLVWLIAVVSAALVVVPDVFLLAFLGLLFAVGLTHLSEWVSAHLRVPYGPSLALVVVLLAAVTGGTFYFFGVRIEQRVRQASSHLDTAAKSLRGWLRQHPIAENAVSDLPFAERLLSVQSGRKDIHARPSNGQQQENENGDRGSAGTSSRSRLGQAAGVVAGVFRTTFGLIVNFLIVLFVALFLASDPALYRDGAVRLFPPQRRERVREILNRMGEALWSWLLGRLASMVITGVGTGICLAVLGVPLPILLGVLTGLLTFIPNIGPAIALAVAVLVALPQGPTTALLVVPIFLVFQLLESYVLTPMIQQRQVSIPPAVLIVWQVLLGVLTGFLGLMVATPILAVIFVLTRTAYLEDGLGEGEAASP